MAGGEFVLQVVRPIPRLIRYGTGGHDSGSSRSIRANRCGRSTGAVHGLVAPGSVTHGPVMLSATCSAPGPVHVIVTVPSLLLTIPEIEPSGSAGTNVK